MSLFFDPDYISSLIFKVEQGHISTDDHAYLQKAIAAQTVIDQFHNESSNIFQKISQRYYTWLSTNWQKKINSPREKTDLFLLKNALERSHYSAFEKKQSFYGKPLNHFEVLSSLAIIWDKPIKRKKQNIITFLTFFLQNVYGIPAYLVSNILMLIENDWKPILSPLGLLPSRKLSFLEIEEYFFGNKMRPEYSLHVIPKIDRFFSVVGKGHKCHIFLPKSEGFDLFEAALVIHEFQHLLDVESEINQVQLNDNALQSDREVFSMDSLFLSEKKALNAERVFLLGAGAAKRGRFCWLESNLFYPILLLKCELNSLVNGDSLTVDFSDVCLSHGMEPLPLSALFEWGAPFQISAYCAAAMDLEQGWQKFLQ